MGTYINEKIIPKIMKLINTKGVQSIKDGMIYSMPLLIVGSVFLILSNFPVQGVVDFLEATGIKSVMDQAYGATFNISAMIAVIDYHKGNLRSVERGLADVGAAVTVTDDVDVLAGADALVLPGVGAFGDAMDKLQKSGLVGVIHEAADQKIPFLGICLGLQLMFESSEESRGVPGLGLLKGRILKIPDSPGLKIPHMGWNSLEFRNNGRLFAGLPQESYVYFVHSYYLKAADEGIVTAVTEYGTQIHASVEQDNIFACQFHPEKSSDVGIRILQNFISI